MKVTRTIRTSRSNTAGMSARSLAYQMKYWMVSSRMPEVAVTRYPRHIGLMRTMLAVIFALAAAGNAGAQAAPASPDPSLVVLITIDGFPANNFDRFGAQLTGGLARIRDGGAWFTNAHHDHAITETAPGHATLLSGRFPASTGIAANRVGVSDPRSPLLGGSGALGASPERFQGSTLFDWLKKKHPRARALSVSAKDRGAILPVGRAKESVFWYPGDGAFTTSSYYSDSLPAWVTRFNEKQLPHKYAGQTWTLVADESAYASPDSVELEGAGNNFMFPHVVPDDPRRAANWIRGTPFIDEVTVAFALEGVTAMQLGKGSHPDLVAISLSGTDANKSPPRPRLARGTGPGPQDGPRSRRSSRLALSTRRFIAGNRGAHCRPWLHSDSGACRPVCRADADTHQSRRGFDDRAREGDRAEG